MTIVVCLHGLSSWASTVHPVGIHDGDCGLSLLLAIPWEYTMATVSILLEYAMVTAVCLSLPLVVPWEYMMTTAVFLCGYLVSVLCRSLPSALVDLYCPSR